jgi:orotate phosphoribosyltransferase
MIKSYQADFIALARRCEALRFGEFVLKSGRTSPYFFNAGAFCTGASLAALGRCYASAIVDSAIEFDVMLGPAYKGIPLVSSVAVALADQHGRDVPWVYNRKEAKSHGEGGLLVGAPLRGRVLIVDDVITAGTAVREVIALIQEAGARCVGVAVGLDRQERGQTERSAIQEVAQEFALEVISIVNLQDLIDYLEAEAGTDDSTLQAMHQYRSQYGVV